MGIRMILLAMMLMFSTSVAAVTIKKSKSDEFCLALAAFTEAGAEGEHGMALVVHTVLNRASRRNKTVCQVTYAPNQYHGVLYWPKGQSPRDFNPEVWLKAKEVVRQVVAGSYEFGKCSGAEFFYAPKIVRAPSWARKLPYLCQYKGHKFYGSI